jgi:hypothetical protein
MNVAEAIRNIRTAIDGAPRNNYTVELHVQMIKYADILKNVTRTEFCEMLGIGSAYGTEFMKMRKIAARLKGSGLNPDKI